MTEPIRIDDHAFDNLRYIRETMERAGSFTSIPGWGGLAIGGTAVVTSIVASRLVDLRWLEAWLIEAVVAASALYLFLVHTFTADEPFVRPALFRDRNFAAGTLFIAIVGISYLASLALLTPYLQRLMNYPIVTAGLVMGPRGIGTMAAMMIVGQLVGRVDTRLLVAIGMGLTVIVMFLVMFISYEQIQSMWGYRTGSGVANTVTRLVGGMITNLPKE